MKPKLPIELKFIVVFIFFVNIVKQDHHQPHGKPDIVGDEVYLHVWLDKMKTFKSFPFQNFPSWTIPLFESL